MKCPGDRPGLLFKFVPFTANESLLPCTGGRSLDILRAPLCLFSKANSQPLLSEHIVGPIRIALDGHVLLSLPLFTGHLISFYFHLSSPSLVFSLLVMLSPSPRGKVNVYLSPRGEVYSFVSLPLQRSVQNSGMNLPSWPSHAAQRRTWLLRLGRRIGSNKRFGRGEKYTD